MPDLTHKQATEIAASLTDEFNKYADLVSIRAFKLDPPAEGYSLRLDIYDDTPWRYVMEIRDAAFAKAGGKFPFHVVVGHDSAIGKFGAAPKPVDAPDAATFKKRPAP